MHLLCTPSTRSLHASLCAEEYGVCQFEQQGNGVTIYIDGTILLKYFLTTIELPIDRALAAFV